MDYRTRRIIGTYGSILFFGLCAFLYGAIGYDGMGLLQHISFILIGAALMAGGGGSLALTCSELQGYRRFFVQIMTRTGYMTVGPLFVLCILTKADRPWETVSILRCVLIAALTVVPFGISLIWLIWKKKEGDG